MRINFYWLLIMFSVLSINPLQAQVPPGFTWQEMHDVDFGTGADHFTMEAASAGSGGEVELRIDAPDGKVIGRVFFHHTGSSDHFMNYECDLNQIVSGNHSVYMNFLDYEEPASGGVLNVGEFVFNQVEEPSNGNWDRLHVYQPVPGLDPSPYYKFEVQKFSDLNSPNLEEVSNWEEPFAFFTKCKDNDPDGNLGYYSKYIGGWSHTYCNVELDKNTPIVVKITRKSDCAPAPSGAIVSAAAHPAKKVDACEVINGAVYVTMSNPSQVSIDIDGQLDSRIAPRAVEGSWDDSAFPYSSEADGAHAVSIFANPFIDKPDINDPGVITVAPGSLPPEADGTWNTLYFLPGVHHFSMTADGVVRDWKVDDFYRLRSNINIYIPGDAFVYGNFTDDNDWKLTENVRIYGHGTICGTHMNHADYADLLDPNYDGSSKHARRLRMLHVTRSENVTFEGITVVDQPHHGCYVWGTDIDGPRNYVKWTKIIGWRVNSDGIHVSKNTVIEDCFLRSQDDGIYVAGQGIKRCVFWTDVNGIPLWCVVITGDRGPDLQQDPLIVEDIDCIYGRGVYQTGAVINAYTAHDAKIYPDGVVNTGQHVYFRNINYEDPLPRRRLISFDAREDQIEDWAGIRFENLTMQYPQVNGLKDQLNGNENVRIKHFTFDNVTIDGVKVDALYLNNPEVFETNNVEDITIRLRDTIPSTDYILTRTAINGSIEFEKGSFNDITLTANPGEGHAFVGWNGDLSGTENPATINVDSDMAITACFITTNTTPFGGTNHAIPGLIEAEHYDEGIAGYAYIDDNTKEGDLTQRPDDNVDIVEKATASNGYTVGYTNNGEMLAYTVDADFGLYDIKLFYYSDVIAGDLILKMDGQVIDTIRGMDNKGATIRDSITIENVLIPEGKNSILKLWFANGAGYEIDAIEFTLVKVPVTGVTLSDCPATNLTEGDTHQLDASVTPEDASDHSVTWNSSNYEVAIVGSDGLVTAVSEGTATITVTTNDGQYEDSCRISVLKKQILVSGVSIDNCPDQELGIGSKHQLSATVTPVDADVKSVKWSSSNTTVVYVDTNGLLSSFSEGTATITVTTRDGGFTDQCQVTVADNTANAKNIKNQSGIVKVYPNPVTDQLHFNFMQSSIKKNIRIYNIYGQLLYTKDTYTNMVINTEEFITEGMLVVEVIEGNYKNVSLIVVEN